MEYKMYLTEEELDYVWDLEERTWSTEYSVHDLRGPKHRKNY